MSLLSRQLAKIEDYSNVTHALKQVSVDAATQVSYEKTATWPFAELGRRANKAGPSEDSTSSHSRPAKSTVSHTEHNKAKSMALVKKEAGHQVNAYVPLQAATIEDLPAQSCDDSTTTAKQLQASYDDGRTDELGCSRQTCQRLQTLHELLVCEPEAWPDRRLR